MNDWIEAKKEIPDPSLNQVHVYCEDESQEIVTWCRDTTHWYSGGWQSCYYCGGRSRVVFTEQHLKRDEKVATHWKRLEKKT